MPASALTTGEDSVSNSPVDAAVSLLSQQIWCWGRDILHPDRNWLQKIGFEKQQPPIERQDCASLYTLRLPNQRHIVLRGFGIFYGHLTNGSIYLPRFEFQPLFFPQGSLPRPPWSDEDASDFHRPRSNQRNLCISLTLDLIDWIRGYEVRILNELGLQYRRDTLCQWNNGKRDVIEPEQVAAAWRELSFKLAANADDYLGKHPS